MPTPRRAPEQLKQPSTRQQTPQQTRQQTQTQQEAPTLQQTHKIIVDEQLITTVARNARLALTPAETKRFVVQFKEILDAFSKVSKVPTNDVALMIHPVPLKNVMRQDIVKPSFPVETALANTQHKKDNYFKGPRIVS
ncbi:TPA: Asp-tRNA(Asn)/Glu-tRNA(Gln) amidotransferase subunit GatC [Candidatus Woesearchaeota archaeon]|nr:MAG: aspartyl-tRNA(Asn)/glutamyl-tRNA (Gln) amidotransferase subunit C [archaeon GW2011_AR16]HIG95930.1 Asp-tRNA(Asn)/Glu-tRNA(Gln) amidotransferase subunit GatC [Candidatus Woesearchaeota archaeon]HIH47398.1 Asp-tRNA(Asn)/Glu-tRNA(Gln) amidotransferase subunit GatC [Candidatus Woesearchaeota archaeon]HII89021.1 Asp-tRNA(Asn)/Glu-tRNA(Gln) amidotransferase subunit GatC [Candidatus Woesearchaeota archaeon]